MAQNQIQQDKDPLRKAEIKTMQADLLAIQRMGGKKDFSAKKEIERKIIPKKVIEEKPKAPIKKPEPPKPINQEKNINKGEEAIKKFESERAQEEARVRAEATQKESEEKRRQEAIAQRKFEEERQKKLAEQIKLEEARRKQQEELKNKRLIEIRQREESMITEREAQRTRERERMQLEDEKMLLQKELESLSSKRAPLEAEVNQLSKRESQLQESLDEVLRKENEAEKEVSSIEAREKTANTNEAKKALEQERWEAEEKRRKVEKERWEWEAEVGKIKDQKREINLRYNKLLNREEEIAEKQRTISDRQEEIQIENEKIELEKELQQLKERQKPLEQEISRLLDRESQLQESLDEVLRKENEAEKEVSSIEAREKTANTNEAKKALEQERWEAEEKRRKVEKERWEWEAEVGIIKGEIKRVEREYQDVLSKEREITAKLYPIKINKDAAKEIPVQPNQQKPQVENVNTNQVKPKVNQQNIGHGPTQEKVTQQKEGEKQSPLQPQEESASSEKLGVKDIQNRQMEVLREIEKLRSETESQKQKTEKNVEPLPIAEGTSAQTENIPSIENNKPNEPIEPTENAPSVAQPTPKKQKFWMREDLQPFNNGSGKEKPQTFASGPVPVKENVIKNRLDELQKEEENERTRFLERIQEGKFKKESSEKKEMIEIPRQDLVSSEILKAVPRRPSGFGKFWSRLLVTITVLVVFGIVFGSIYYFFFVRKAQIPLAWCEKEQAQIPQPEWNKERCVPPPIVIPEIEIPVSLIPVDFIEDKEITASNDIPIRLNEVLSKEFEKSKFVRIIIKDLRDPKNRHVLTLNEFLDFFSTKTPAEFYPKLDPNATLFIFTQPEGKRFGFVASIVDSTRLIEITRLWEDTMEQDLQGLFSLLGKTGPALTEGFVRVNYNNTTIRCQTFSKEDFGSCYAITPKYFVFTTSLASMQKTLSVLK